MSDESTSESPSEIEMLRAEMREGFQSVVNRFDQVDARLAGHDKRFDEVNQRFGEVDKRITNEAEGTRRRFDVVAEDLRQSFTGVIDQTTATGKKVDRLIATNAVEHAAFLDAIADHEVRVTRLEKEAR